MLLENFCVNGTADVTFPGATEAEAGAMPEFIGNPTECALLVAAHKAGLDYRIRRELANRLRGESRPVPSNPMLVWMPLELFALLLNDGLALGPDDGQD